MTNDAEIAAVRSEAVKLAQSKQDEIFSLKESLALMTKERDEFKTVAETHGGWVKELRESLARAEKELEECRRYFSNHGPQEKAEHLSRVLAARAKETK